MPIFVLFIMYSSKLLLHHCVYFPCASFALPSHHAHVVSDSLVVQETLNRSQRRNGHILVPQVLLRKCLDVLLGDGVNAALNLLRRLAAAGRHNLTANVLGNSRGRVKGKQELRLELGLGALKLGRGDGHRQAVPLLQGEVDQVVQVGKVVGNKVDAPETSVAV